MKIKTTIAFILILSVVGCSKIDDWFAPTVSTYSTSDIGPYTATVNGYAYATGTDIYERGIIYGISPDPKFGGSYLGYRNVSSGGGAIKVNLSGLSFNTIYFARVYANYKNSQGSTETAYGNTVQFQTLSGKATVITNAVTNITSTEALCSGNIIDDGMLQISERGFIWGLSTNPTFGGSYQSYKTSGIGLGAYSATIQSLQRDVKYYVRAYARNAAGIFYGETKEFTTQK